MLLDYKADINITNNKNYTPLAYAITYGDVSAAKMLIAKGADVNHKVDKGRNMTDLARVSGNDSIIDLIHINGGKTIPGLDFSELNLTFGNSFNKTDHLIQFRGGLVNMKCGVFFETGVDYRPYLLKIQTLKNDTIFQFRERRIGWSHSIGKYQKLYLSSTGFRISLYGSMNGYLSFPQYQGSSANPGMSYKIIPSAGLVFSGNDYGIKLGADWYNYPNLRDKGPEFNLSVFFRISSPEVHYDRKEINWE